MQTGTEAVMIIPVHLILNAALNHRHLICHSKERYLAPAKNREETLRNAVNLKLTDQQYHPYHLMDQMMRIA